MAGAGAGDRRWLAALPLERVRAAQTGLLADMDRGRRRTLRRHGTHEDPCHDDRRHASRSRSSASARSCPRRRTPRRSGTTSRPAATASATCRRNAGIPSCTTTPTRTHRTRPTRASAAGSATSHGSRWRGSCRPAGGQRADGRRPEVGGRGTRAALLDAGWPDWTVDPERVAVIIGNAIGGDKQYRSNLRIEFPEFARDLRAAPSFAALPGPGARRRAGRDPRRRSSPASPAITEDTMPGELANVHRRPGGQPVQLPRPQLHHRRGVRLRRWPRCRPRCADCRPATSTPPSPAASTATWTRRRS